jgi:tetratricopeptide repeat protein 30
MLAMRTLNGSHRTNNKSITPQVYGCIRDGEFTKAIEILDSQLGDRPKSRPILSLLAYCCYNNKDYARAAEFYEELIAVCPEVEEYYVLYAQSLVMAGAHHDASRVTVDALSRSSSADTSIRLRLLQARSQLELGMFAACNKTLSHCKEDDPETIIALAVVDYAEEKFDSALKKKHYSEASHGQCADAHASHGNVQP